MAEFIFDLQRFDSSGSGSSGGGNGGGSSSGGSGGNNTYTGYSSTGHTLSGTNVGYGNTGHTRSGKTDANIGVIIKEVWTDSLQVGNYSSLAVNGFINESNALRGLISPTQYTGTVYGEAFDVSTLNNNTITNTDSLDSINFVDATLDSLAQLVEGDGYYDLIFNRGTITRIYTEDENFLPQMNFATGLSEIYSPNADAWFTPQELDLSLDFWSTANFYAGSEFIYGESPLISRSVNNVVSGLGLDDSVLLYDTSLYRNDIFSVNTDSDKLGFVFRDGTATLVNYNGTFSPKIYTNDYGSGFVYNSLMDAWRTVDQAYTDAAQYEADAAQAAAEQAAYEANFNVIIDEDATDDDGHYLYKDYEPFAVSRFNNTLFYNTRSNNDLLFYDATWANVLGIVPTDDYHLDIYFDTGLITEVEYLSTVSPILKFADGTNQAYNWATGDFCDAYSGGYAYDENGFRYFTENDVFAVSRAADSFINKVTSNDDILLADTTYANITNINVIGGYAISMDFDTGANLRVQDASYVSPVFHFGDGTQTAYNWIDDQWAGAFDTNAGVAETVAVSASTSNFVRNADQIDNICIVDATVGDILDIHVDSSYINLRFDTGVSTAVKYEDYVSPEFTFADGTQYYFNLEEGKWQTPAELLASSADLFEDTTIASDATLSDIVAPVADVASFDATSPFELQSAGEFVAAAIASANPTHKSA